MKINKKTVQKWIKIYAETQKVNRKIGSGRKRKTTDDQDGEIINELIADRFATAKNICEKLKEKQILISIRTIQNRLNYIGLSYGLPKTKPLLTDDHKAKRLLWAHNNVNTNWNHIGFSDEASFWKKSVRRRWLFANDYESVVKHPLKVHVWGYIARGIKRFDWFEGILDAVKYVEILTMNLLDIAFKNPNLIFQDDNDPKHRSKYVTIWKGAYEIKSLEWPPNSPDLNPIENVWALLKNEVAKAEPKTKEDFIKCIQSACDQITMKTIDNLIDSMPSRIQEVIKNAGDITSY